MRASSHGNSLSKIGRRRYALDLSASVHRPGKLAVYASAICNLGCCLWRAFLPRARLKSPQAVFDRLDAEQHSAEVSVSTLLLKTEYERLNEVRPNKFRGARALHV